ncbi:MAG TPA: hypothetical protein VNT30_10435 [Stellaceae bacterium]|nr:hypothetical protein [Stellaceae bacterium]
MADRIDVQFGADAGPLKAGSADAAAAIAAASAAMRDSLTTAAMDAMASVVRLQAALASVTAPIASAQSGASAIMTVFKAINAAAAAPLPATQAAGKEQNRLQIWRDALDQQLLAEHAYFDNSKREELAFWQAKLTETTNGSKEQLEVRRQIFALQRGLDQQERADALQVNQAKLSASLDPLKVQEVAVQRRKELGQIDGAQEITQLKDIERQRLVIEIASLADRRALYADDQKEQQRIDVEILKAKRSSDDALAKLDQQAAQNSRRTWDSVANSITGAFRTSINGIIQGTQTLSQAFSRLGEHILESMASNFIDIALKWVSTRLYMLTFGEAADTAAAASSAAASTSGALAQIKASAAAAFAAAYAAIVGIPYVGPALAPAAGALAYGEVMASAAGLAVPSAAGGWLVPQDTLLKVHENERVLPAKYAAGLDAMVGQAANGTGSTGGDTHYHTHHYTIDATDPATFKKQLLANKDGVFGAVQAHARNLGQRL